MGHFSWTLCSADSPAVPRGHCYHEVISATRAGGPLLAPHHDMNLGMGVILIPVSQSGKLRLCLAMATVLYSVESTQTQACGASQH
jgi:hypothetical protein